MWLGDGGRRQPVRLLRLSREPAGMHPPGGTAPFIAGLAASRHFVPSAGRAEHGSVADHPERGARRSPRSRCAECGRRAMAPSRPRGTGGRAAPPGPGAGSWSTRRPGTSRAWFRRENSPAGSGRWTRSPMCPVCPPTWGRSPRLTVPRWWIWSSTATPSCWLTGPGGRHGPMRSWCPAAIATDGRRPRLPNWRPAVRR